MTLYNNTICFLRSWQSINLRRNFLFSLCREKSHAILTAYLANSEGDQLMNSVQNLNYITTICLNYCNLRVYIIYFKGILRINEHLFHHVEAYGGGRWKEKRTNCLEPSNVALNAPVQWGQNFLLFSPTIVVAMIIVETFCLWNPSVQKKRRIL